MMVVYMIVFERVLHVIEEVWVKGIVTFAQDKLKICAYAEQYGKIKWFRTYEELCG
jgi:hypothetical protein